MPKKLSVKDVKGSAHPYSRKARQLERSHLREDKLKTGKEVRWASRQKILDKAAFFKFAISDDDSVASADQVHDAVTMYMQRNDKEIARLEAETRPNRPRSKNLPILYSLKEQEEKEYLQGILEIPDLRDADNVKVLKEWNGGEDSFARIKWARKTRSPFTIRSSPLRSPTKSKELKMLSAEAESTSDKTVVDYITRELVAAGFLSAELEKEEREQVPPFIVNTLFLLLQQRQKDADVREELTDRLRRTTNEYEMVNAALAKTKAKVEAAERDNDFLSMKIEATEKSLKDVNTTLSSTKEELRVTKFTLQQAKAQFLHEVRKKERDQEKWKERHLARPDSKPSGPPGKQGQQLEQQKIRIINPLRPTITPRVKKEDEIYGLVIKTYEDREKEVLVENEDLRETLHRIYCMLRERHAECARMHGDDTVSELKDRSAQFRLPLNIARQALAQLILDAMESLRQEFQIVYDKYLELSGRAAEASGAVVPEAVAPVVVVNHEELDVLKKQLGVCQQIIDEQNRLLNLSLAPENGMDDNDPEYRFLESTQDDVNKQMEEIRRQREQLESERRRFTDAAVKLGVERVNLQRDREEFEEEIRAFETRRVLSTMPPTPGWLTQQQQHQATPFNRPQRAFRASGESEILAESDSLTPTGITSGNGGGIYFSPSVSTIASTTPSSIKSVLKRVVSLPSQKMSEHPLQQQQQNQQHKKMEQHKKVVISE
ncbi:hypothetical protein SmJEL517_g05777 [Synchytrium microbalum]|uniref:Uncharacterized protein n=1 Tax=Synchytrium microbalum TaxID=1806994 RepID=A0A507BUR6_9FUNG|nr:uncharacterized protein SmJEL517_g05777 [Synchytrium microbalum]TPX30729.1 hypothetical protein SmJEL517_g05777 [Synchytrium microbalum]